MSQEILVELLAVLFIEKKCFTSKKDKKKI